MTVPSCFEHNTAKSKLDEKFRLYIQAMETNDIATSAFKDKTLRGLKREEAAGFRKKILDNSFNTEIEGERRLVMRIDIEEQSAYFGAIIRGLYHYHTGLFSIDLYPNSFSLRFQNGEQPSFEAITEELAPELAPNLAADGDFKNPRVFRYRYRLDDTKKRFLVLMDFYEGVEVFGTLVPTLEIEGLNK